jgi:hypothetical protein
MGIHDKHQYFYEKYLRNEMPDSERTAFEEKLSADAGFRKSFQYYERNRGRMLHDLIEEDDRSEKRWTVNSWLYLLISLVGIGLAIHYFSSAPEPLTAAPAKKEDKPSLFDRIGFGQTAQAPPSPVPVVTPPVEVVVPAGKQHEKEEETISPEEHVAEETEESTHEPADVMSDLMLADTFLASVDYTYYHQRVQAIRTETDSVLNDSAVQSLAMRSTVRNPDRAKAAIVFVEFWKSPVNFKGYRFTGKKLTIYGIQSPFEVGLLRKDETLILRTSWDEIPLLKDQTFHKF